MLLLLAYAAITGVVADNRSWWWRCWSFCWMIECFRYIINKHGAAVCCMRTLSLQQLTLLMRMLHHTWCTLLAACKRFRNIVIVVQDLCILQICQVAHASINAAVSNGLRFDIVDSSINENVSRNDDGTAFVDFTSHFNRIVIVIGRHCLVHTVEVFIQFNSIQFTPSFSLLYYLRL